MAVESPEDFGKGFRMVQFDTIGVEGHFC
jgi:hypothetical protein